MLKIVALCYRYANIVEVRVYLLDTFVCMFVKLLHENTVCQITCLSGCEMLNLELL